MIHDKNYQPKPKEESMRNEPESIDGGFYLVASLAQASTQEEAKIYKV